MDMPANYKAFSIIEVKFKGSRKDFYVNTDNIYLEAGELVWMGGDVHLYLNHAELVHEQLSRLPEGSPRLELTRRPETIFDYAIEDFAVTGYAPQGAISAPVAV